MKELAEHYLRSNFDACWSPAIEMNADKSTDDLQSERKGKKRKATSLVGSMLTMGSNLEIEDSDEEDMEDDIKRKDKSHLFDGCDGKFNWANLSEVDKYLQLPQLPHTNEDGKDVDILSWWKRQVNVLPYLAKMARQYLAHPCSSAGNVFSNLTVM